MTDLEEKRYAPSCCGGTMKTAYIRETYREQVEGERYRWGRKKTRWVTIGWWCPECKARFVKGSSQYEMSNA